MVSGLDSPWSQEISDLSSITIDGDSYTIGGIDLGNSSSSSSSGSSIPNPYSVAITGAVTISGDVYTYGGDFNVSLKPRAGARERDGITIGPDGGVTISTSSLGAAAGAGAADAMATYGAITLSSESQAVDVPLDLWFPLTKRTISIGSATGPATSVIGGALSISSEAILEPWQKSFHVSKLLFPAFNYSNVARGFESFFGIIGDGVVDGGLFLGESLVDNFASALQDVILPVSVKTSTANDAINIANSIIKAQGGNNALSITSSAKAALDLKDMTINGANLIQALTPNWVPNLASTFGFSTAKSQVLITGSSLSAAGNVTISSDSSNQLDSEAKVEKYVLMTDGVGGPGFAPSADKPGEAIAVGKTTTKAEVTLDASSSITAAGTVSMTTNAKPDTHVKAETKTYRDGHVTTGVAIALDDTKSQLNINGSITQGGGGAQAQPKRNVDASSTAAPTEALALPPNGSSLSAPPTSNDTAEPPLDAVPVAHGQAFAVGDRVSFQQLGSPADLIASVDADGQVTVESATGEVLATGGGGQFSVAPGQLLGWTDGTILEYRGGASRSLGVNEIDLSSPDWQPVSVARPGANYVVTAINGDGSSPADGSARLTLADAAPLQLDSRGTTGHQHAIYQIQTVPIVATGSGVDLDNDELILGGEPSQWPAAGQLVQYYVLNQGGDNDNSATIGGLSPGGDYFVIPRGAGRIALAVSPQEALAGVAVDLTSTGSGPEHLLRFEQGQTPTLAVTLEPLASGDPVASMATQAQQDLIVFSGGGAEGDTLTITLLNQARHSDTQFVTETLTANDLIDPSGLRDRFLAAINATPGLTQGEGAEIGSVAYLTAVASGSSGILLTATTPGVGFGAQVTARDSNSDPLTTPPAILSEPAANGQAINGLNWQLTPASGAAVPLHGQMVQWSSGLLQQANGTLVGADAFLTARSLTASSQLIGADGAPLTATQQVSLDNGSIVYWEQDTPSGGFSGGYWRYLGDSGAFDATSLASSLEQASQWLPGAGPMLEVFNPEQATTSFRLLSSDAAPWQLPGAILNPLSWAPVLLTVDAPWMSFDPSSSVNATNDTLYLPGLNASTGDVVSYYVDPKAFDDTNSQILVAVDPTTAVVGTNHWSDVSIDPILQDAAPVVNGAPLVSARYFSGYSSLLQPGASTSTGTINQLVQGQTIYLRPSADSSAVEVFTDAAAQNPLVFTNTSRTGADNLLLNVPSTQRQNTPVHGLHNGDQLQLISLGHDHYQLTTGGVDQARALPQQVLPRQINPQTTLAGQSASSTPASSTQATANSTQGLASPTQGVTSPPAAVGLNLEATIDGRNRAYVLSRSERLPTPYGQQDWMKGPKEYWKGLVSSRTNLMTGMLGSNLVSKVLKDKATKPNQNTNATFGFVGAVTINKANQKSTISIGNTANISANGDINLNNTIFELYNSAAIAEMMLESAKLSAAVSIVDNGIDNQATNSINGSIQTLGSVNPTAAVVEPSATWFPIVSLGSAYSQPTPTDGHKKGIRATETSFKTLAAVLAEGTALWKNLQDDLFPQLLNSYSNIRNRGHLTELAKVQATTPVEGQTDRYGNQLLNTIWQSKDTGDIFEGDGSVPGKDQNKAKLKANPVWKKDANGNPESKNGDAAYAIEKLKLATQVKKFKDPEVYANLGDAYRKFADGGNAVLSYQAALGLDPNYARALYRTGKVYQTQGVSQEPIYLKYYEDALAKDPIYAPVFENYYKYYYESNVSRSAEYLENWLPE